MKNSDYENASMDQTDNHKHCFLPINENTIQRPKQ